MFALRLIAGRLVLAMITLLLVSGVIFVAIEIIPGDVATRILGRDATPETLAALRARMHLDLPPMERYIRWLSNIVLYGDFGRALTSDRAVGEIIAPKVVNTLMLAAVAFVLYLPLALVPATVQALNRDGPVDHALSVINLALLSIPDFLLGTLLMIVFVIRWRWFPAIAAVRETMSFSEYLWTVTLPAITLALVMAVYAVRMLRDNLIEVLDAEYVRMAELMGLSRLAVLIRHALPNALIPTLNVTALNLAYVIGGVVIVERLFTYPGFGSLLIDALQLQDAPLVEAAVLISAAIYIAANLFADIGAILLNPRLRRG
jgi:peptide/nickel transport system permease protein